MKILDLDGNDVGDFLDLDVLEHGKVKKYTFTLFNDNRNGKATKIRIIESHQDVEFLEVPETIEKNSKKNFKVEWSPALNVEKGLKTSFEITAALIFE